ncbi:PREDICTED: uncharacterized protein LOC108562501 [Nicrophorus vespilloides]|uniref:Uncharacterized protein LOC108562501 n=1 Tax=Nicrophorus vespilloides TaxID=110193 RepID=A0ABM1MP53_NICVS|nr:PREDICTED: uncharacterized protein LOC108562501 [Nicrophorus vespilloides]
MSMEEAAMYLIRFATLGGENLKEHNELFGELCRDLKKLELRYALLILKSFAPVHKSTLQECFFYTKLLFMFGELKTLLQMSFGKNKLINRKIVRNKTFINFVSTICLRDFVNDVCMKTSYINRLYMIRKISRLVPHPEIFFFTIFSAFGFESARPFLPYCSMEVVKVYLTERHITFNDKSLLSLHRKDPTFLKLYFKVTKDKLRKKLCIALCKDKVLLELNKDLIFGKRSFRDFYNLNKAYVLKNSLKFVKFAKTIIVMYGIEDYRIFLKNMLPKYEDDFKITKEIIQTLLALSKKQRFNEFYTIYKDLYCRSFVDANEDLVMIITTEDRLKLDIGVRLEYLLASESLQRFRAMKNISEETLKKMIICCKVNNCTDTLLEVLTAFSKCFLYKKNKFLIAFMKNLKMIPVENLGERHWHYINTYLTYVKKFSVYDLPIFLHYFINYALFKMRQRVRCEEVLISILRYSIASDDLRFFKHYPEVERYFLMSAPPLIDSIDNVDNDELKLKYYYSLYLYNNDNRSNQFTLFSFPTWFPNYIRKLHKPDSKCMYKVYHIIIELWKQDTESMSYMDYREEVLTAYFNNMTCMISENLLLWFLTNKPRVIEIFLDTIISKTQPYLTYFNFYYELNKMAWLGLANKLSKFCMLIYNAQDVFLGRGVFQFLSYSSNFGNATQSYDPTVCDLSMYNSKVLQECHRSLLLGGKNFIYPETAVPFVLKYCSFQYFKYFTPTFYNLIFHSSHEFVQKLLIEILKGRYDFPVWKHGIYLTYRMLNQTLFINYITERIRTEPDPEVFKWIFKIAVKQLVENCHESTLNIIAKSNKLIDLDGISELKHFKNVPTKLFCDFVRFIWKKNDQTEIIKYITVEAITLFPTNFNIECLELAFHTLNIDYMYNFCSASFENVDLFTTFAPTNEMLHKIVNRAVKERNAKVAKYMTCSLLKLTYSMRIKLVLLQRYMSNHEMFVVDLISYHDNLFEDYTTSILPSCRSIIREFVIELGIDQLELAEGLMNYNYKVLRLKLLALDMLPSYKAKDLNFNARLSRVLNLIRKDSNDVICGYCNLYLSGIR